jgi:glycine/serine hydroxymethyltransferase
MGRRRTGKTCERPRGGVVTQRSAKPFTPVQFRAWPPIFARENSADRCAAKAGATRLAASPAFKVGSALLYALARERAASFPGSSAVEQPAVNRLVAGSNPARGAKTN